ncbi:MAG: hypothetical protein DWQ37_20235, partial [Planctomycetota bacterium]
MASRIYLLGTDAKLKPMDQAAYESERLLQELLASYSDLLAGEQINSDEPRRWIFVAREMGVAGEVDGERRWSLDHLFLDQDAVPTLVEIKRSTDTRIRREVVGQMLDYAANAVAYWPVEQIQAKFEARCQADGTDPEDELASLVEDEAEVDDFWQRVKTNLQAGRIRMVFVADAIPAELRRIIEFLNSQMDPAEVLAIEVKQYIGEGVKTLVPRVLGQTETARQKKSPSAVRQSVAEEVFLQQFEAQRPPAELKVARKLIAWATEHGLRTAYREGQRGTAFIPVVAGASREHYPFSLRTNGKIHVQLRWLKTAPPFNDQSKREQ